MTDTKRRLRPIIPSVKITEEMTEIEQFQNGVLRPILKFQHGILVLQFKQFYQLCNSGFKQLNTEKQLDFIDVSYTKHQALKHQTIGIVTGLLEKDEYLWYNHQQKEIHKRILQMVKERIKTHLDAL